MNREEAQRQLSAVAQFLNEKRYLRAARMLNNIVLEFTGRSLGSPDALASQLYELMRTGKREGVATVDFNLFIDGPEMSTLTITYAAHLPSVDTPGLRFDVNTSNTAIAAKFLRLYGNQYIVIPDDAHSFERPIFPFCFAMFTNFLFSLLLWTIDERIFLYSPLLIILVWIGVRYLVPVYHVLLRQYAGWFAFASLYYVFGDFVASQYSDFGAVMYLSGIALGLIGSLTGFILIGSDLKEPVVVSQPSTPELADTQMQNVGRVVCANCTANYPAGVTRCPNCDTPLEARGSTKETIRLK